MGTWNSWNGLDIKDIVWPGGSHVPPQGVPEKFHIRITFLEEPPFIIISDPDPISKKCSMNRGVPCYMQEKSVYKLFFCCHYWEWVSFVRLQDPQFQPDTNQVLFRSLYRSAYQIRRWIRIYLRFSACTGSKMGYLWSKLSNFKTLSKLTYFTLFT